MILEFEILGKAKAKQSCRFTRNGFKYTPSDIVQYSNLVKISFINSYPNWDIQTFKDKALKVQIDVYFSIPKAFSKQKHLKALQGEIRPIVKPDCDNIAKNINDSLNGIAYPDDKQIACLIINKHYAEAEKVKVRIEEIPQDYPKA